MKNYYEILEVSEKASNEVIEKAYKVLVKKYHPDLQQEKDRKQAEEKMKQINEAYEILSDNQKKMEFDASLQRQRQEQIRQEENRRRQQDTYNQTSYYQEETKQNTTIPKKEQKVQMQEEGYQEYRKRQDIKEQEASYGNVQEELYKKQLAYQKKYQEAYERKMQQEIENQYRKQYYRYLRSLGYRIKEKWTWKKTLKLIEIIGITIVVIMLLWVFPPTRNWMLQIYEENQIIKIVVNVIGGLFKAIWQSIARLFTNPPTI